MTEISNLPRRIRDGDKQAEAEFVSHFSVSVRLILERRTKDRELALDLTQDTLITCIEQLRAKELDDAQKLANYVHRVAVLKAANANRTRRRRATDSRSDLLESLPSSTSDPLSQLSRKASADAVGQLLRDVADQLSSRIT